MKLDAQSLYFQLGQLVREMPDFCATTRLSHEQSVWLGRACAIVETEGEHIDSVQMNISAQNLTGALRATGAQTISAILYKLLAIAEAKAPVSDRGAFIPAGNAYDALAAVARVVGSAATDVLIVDPYMDEKTLREYATLARETCSIRLLSDSATAKPSLKPAVEAWKKQYSSTRPLECRVTMPRMLHDRLIIVDGLSAYTLTQSLNSFATRAPASIVRADTETSALKAAAYRDIWDSATTI